MPEEQEESEERVCSYCGDPLEPDPPGDLCAGCEETTSVCCACGERHSNDEVCWGEEDVYCRSCWQAAYFECDDCGETTSRDYGAWEESGSGCWCDNCGADHWCGECDAYHRAGPCESRIVLSYCSRPNILHILAPEYSGPILGFELELVTPGDREDYAQELIDAGLAADEPGCDEMCICVEDSSIGEDGIEIVTRKAPLDYWLSSPEAEGFFEILEGWRKRGCRSHNTGTCGLHVSTDVSALSALQLFKSISVLDLNTDFTMALSSRSESQLRQWAPPGAMALGDRAVETLAAKCKCKVGHKYSAVNIQGARAEFRVFRGTMLTATIKARLETVAHLVHEFPTSRSVRECKPQFWLSAALRETEHCARWLRAHRSRFERVGLQCV